VREAIMTLARTYGIDPELPFNRLPRKHRDLVLYGPGTAGGPGKASKGAKAAADANGEVEDHEDDESPEFELPRRLKVRASAKDQDPFGRGFEGVIPNLRRRYEEGSWAVQEDLEPYRMLRECP